METENKDWKPEVGGKAWILRHGNEAFEVMVDKIYEESALVSDYLCVYHEGARVSCKTSSLHQTVELALANAVIRVYDLEGKEVVIPRADGFLAGKVLGIQMENDLLRKPVTTLAQAQMLLYEHGMMLDLSGLSPILIERGGAAIGGKLDGSLKAAYDLNESDQGIEIPWEEGPMRDGLIGGKSDQREGGC